MSLAAWKPGSWKANAWKAGAWLDNGATPQPETRPASGGGRAYPQRDATPKRRDDDELLLLVLL